MPPDRGELEAMQRQLIELWGAAGASVVSDQELAVDLVRWPGRGIAFNHAARPRWTERDWSTRATAVAARLQEAGEAPTLVVVDALDTPQGLADRLVASGWLEIGLERILWTRRAAVVPHLDPAARVEALTKAGVAAYEALEREIFGVADSESGDRRAALDAGLGEGRLRAYVVRLGGEPIATARLIRGDGVAALQGVGVVPSRRGQGYGTLVTTIATRAGLASGARVIWLSVDAANGAAQALYEGLDYRPALTWRRLIAPPEAVRSPAT